MLSGRESDRAQLSSVQNADQGKSRGAKCDLLKNDSAVGWDSFGQVGSIVPSLGNGLVAGE